MYDNMSMYSIIAESMNAGWLRSIVQISHALHVYLFEIILNGVYINILFRNSSPYSN